MIPAEPRLRVYEGEPRFPADYTRLVTYEVLDMSDAEDLVLDSSTPHQTVVTPSMCIMMVL